MTTKEVSDIALTAGEILLCSGSEIYRVEDTINRICSSFDRNCEVFVMPTGIFLSCRDLTSREEPVTLIKRIDQRTIDLHCIELVNSFTQNIDGKSMTYEKAMAELQVMASPPVFNPWVRFMGAAMTAFAYTLLFGGALYDGIVAAAAGILIMLLTEKASVMQLSEFFTLFMAGILAATTSLVASAIFSRITLGLHIDPIIIGSIMGLVPGVAITNGIRDALHGDIVASVSRLSEALFAAVAIGSGVGITLIAGLKWM